MSKVIRMIDPPNGHAFGFPKPFYGDEDDTIDAWLLVHGYPKEWVELFPNGVPCRIMEMEEGQPPE